MSFKSGYISVVGVPNAGKSSLVNALIKETVSIVTAKPQTTRKRTLGILNDPEKYQMIFVDTPGVIESTAGLNSFLKSELADSLKGVDVIIAAVAPWEFEKEEMPWVLKMTEKIQTPVIYVATQTDKKNGILEAGRLNRWTQWNRTGTLLATSARTSAGLDQLKDKILESLPEGPQYYDAELFTPQTMREMAAETVRKQCFELLHQEIPYGLAVMVRKFEEGKVCNIEADIIVSKESHKGMVIGKGGGVLKEIGSRARHEIERLFDGKIFLKLHVVVKPSWIQNKDYLVELGYHHEA